jgi:RNA polymerase sigma factor (sigma-70 family)
VNVVGTTDRREAAEQPPDEDAVWKAVARVITDYRDLRILSLRYKDGWSYRQIGQEIGISNQRVQQLLKRAMARLRAAGSVFAGVA